MFKTQQPDLLVLIQLSAEPKCFDIFIECNDGNIHTYKVEMREF